MTHEESYASEMRAPPRAPGASVRIIAAGIIIGFCYWAGSVVMTVLLSVLVAYFLDPAVEWLERFRMPRVIGALVIVLLMLALVLSLAVWAWSRVDSFAGEWPKYSAVLKQAARAVDERLKKIERRFMEITPQADQPAAASGVDMPPVRQMILNWLGGLYSLVLASAFVPFLVFFMLSAKRSIWHATLQLFSPTQRTQVKTTLDDVAAVLRGYVAGNALIALILSVASMLFFWAMGLDYPFLTGIVSGLLNLVPYFGVVLAMVPPMIVGLVKFKTVTPFIVIAMVVGFFHMMALNALYPALVGRRVHLNAIAVTIALLFWGWMWGVGGFLLAIPITATIKVICDHVEGWEPAGRWLGA